MSFTATLQRLGVGAGDRVASFLHSRPETFVALLACASLGAIWSNCGPDLFLDVRAGQLLDDALRIRLRAAIAREASPRHVPDDFVAIEQVPRTLTGKKMEVPVRKLLLGLDRRAVASDDAMANPRSLDFFERFAAQGKRSPAQKTLRSNRAVALGRWASVGESASATSARASDRFRMHRHHQ